jgi:DNA-directed RNA polymerase specialized sigma24 family protein
VGQVGPVRGSLRDGADPEQYFDRMSSGASTGAYDRVHDRRRAAALARHFREAEGLTIAEIADRLGRSPAMVKAYF